METADRSRNEGSPPLPDEKREGLSSQSQGLLRIPRGETQFSKQPNATFKMNFLSALVLVATAAVGHCVPINQASPTADQIKELTAATMLFFTSALPNTTSAPLPSFSNERIRIPEIDTDATATGKNGMAYGIDQVLLDQYEFDASTLATKFRLTSPNFTIVYDIEVEGKIFGHKVSGEGVLRQEVFGEGYVLSNLRFEEINHSLQIASLELSLLMENVIIDLEGVTVDGISVQQLEKLMENYVLTKFNEAKEKQSKLVADTMKSQFNKSWTGYSTDEVIQWLRDHSNRSAQIDLIQKHINSLVRVL
ncbi:hypothetical protein GE061_016648 [Apolygus lucorum]|uniref:Uncharacterized protein n=1 Tax=Apolygus lucorum TaxID=248454 RepID=A0A8S9XJF9_APOLU|nr:hypothetical protein GE061_016648 [Apolygus lucorum]